jgi:hypothetical protein
MFDIGRTYHVIGSPSLGTAGNLELVSGLATANMAFILTHLFIGQVATEALTGIEYTISRVTGYTTGSGGSAVTPAPRVSTDPAATSTWLAGNTTAVTGTFTVVRQRVIQVVSGDEYVPLPNDFLQFNLSQAIQVKLITALPATTSVYFDMTIVELL